MEYGKDQEIALESMTNWWNGIQAGDNVPQVFYLAGYAGTGKTTIANSFVESISKPKQAEDVSIKSRTHILYGAYTGKAALRMHQAGMRGAQTLHSLIYTVSRDDDNNLIWELTRNTPLVNSDLLILDECSMVGEDLATDVLSYEKPILVIGDPGQLPPIKGLGYFTNRKPDARLEEVHRQALENPIIELATDIRNGKPVKKYNESNLKTYASFEDLRDYALQYDQVITGKNATRNTINDFCRKHYGYDNKFGNAGDKIIFLRNNRRDGIFNGLMGTLKTDSMYEGSYDNSLEMPYVYITYIDEEDKAGTASIHPECFEPDSDKFFKGLDWHQRKKLNEIDFGYCVTVHKSQGSQWDNVVFVDDGMFNWGRDYKLDRIRWLYTGVTRAANNLIMGRSK